MIKKLGIEVGADIISVIISGETYLVLTIGYTLGYFKRTFKIKGLRKDVRELRRRLDNISEQEKKLMLIVESLEKTAARVNALIDSVLFEVVKSKGKRNTLF